MKTEKIEEKEILDAAKQVSAARTMFVESGRLLDSSQKDLWGLLMKKFPGRKFGSYQHDTAEIELLD